MKNFPSEPALHELLEVQFPQLSEEIIGVISDIDFSISCKPIQGKKKKEKEKEKKKIKPHNKTINQN